MTSLLTTVPAGEHDTKRLPPVCPETPGKVGVFRRIPTDQAIAAALAAGRIRVDHVTGAITGPAGNRLERVDRRNASGKVRVRRRPTVYAPAHKIVWIAVYGPIDDPVRTSVKHRNDLRWDNRPCNLYLAPRRGFITYPNPAS